MDEVNHVRTTFAIKGGAQGSEIGASIIRRSHTPDYKTKITRKEWSDLFSVENLGPSGSKGEVYKVKNNRSIIKCDRNFNGSG